ncbi:MAG: polysaccharide pyruvyl transferase family protein [Opitutaceae bacterium]
MQQPENTAQHFGLIGASFAGNKGAEAMLLASIDQLQMRWPNAVIHVLSYLPNEDIQLERRERVFIHSATPATLVLKWLPISFALRIFPSLKTPLPLKDNATIRSLVQLDAVFDIFGVSFMDSRLKFLPFNVLSLFPFLLHKVPTIKLSQALGTFSKFINRFTAKILLSRLTFTTARGHRTRSLLDELSIKGAKEKFINASDVAFLLKPSPTLNKISTNQKIIGIIPSLVVDSKLPDYKERLIEIARRLHQDGWTIHIIAHSWRANVEDRRHNDPIVAKPIIQQLTDEGIPTKLIGPGLNSVQIRDNIGKCSIVLTSRFHGMIAALATARPPIVVGWSHKYEEVLAPFSLEKYSIAYKDFSAEHTFEMINEVHRSMNEISSKIRSQLPQTFNNSELQFAEAEKRLNV